MIEWIAIFGAGALSSFVGSLLGLGGGFILVPILSLQLGFDMKTSIFLSLLNIFWLSIIKMFQFSDLIQSHRSLVRRLGIFSALGAGISAWIGSRASDESLNLIFGSILILVSIYFILDRRPHIQSPIPEAHPLWFGRMMFLFSGGLGGLLGIGGGILNVPTLHRAFRFDMNLATKLNFPFLFISGGIALLVLFQERREEIIMISPIIILALLLGTSMGSMMSSKVKFSSQSLKVIFSSLLFVLGAIKIYKAW